LLGQHSSEVLKDWLGMSEEQVAALRTDKVI
jgi:crotonobetainyl-CoA:carnitine CoA-transferase CaiB-like acyl-CoA transferase